MDSPDPASRIESLLAHREWVRRLALTLVQDESRAADLEQQVWLSALQRPPRHLDAPRGWLATALRHAAGNLRRGEARRGRHEEGAARRAEEVPAADLVAEAETQRRVVDAVLGLDEPYRSAVLQRWFDDLGPREIARRQGISEETVRTRLRRALEQLRDRLDRESGGDRRRWMLGLAPLARRADSEDARSSIGAEGPLVQWKARTGIAAAMLALLGAVGWFSVDAENRLVRGEDARDTATSSAPADGPGGTRVPDAAGHAREPASLEPPRRGPRRTEIRPSGTLVVRLVDRSTGKAVSGIGVEIAGTVCGRLVRTSDGDALEQVVELPEETREDTLRVSLLQQGTSVALTDLGEDIPRTRGRVSGIGSREVTLRDGGREFVDFEWSPTGEVRGRVISAAGDPVEGALVYLGEQVLARGDEPFRPFNPSRVPHAVRTGPDGGFVLRSDGAVVTAWHPAHSPVTVPAKEATEIRLPARGALRGRLVDSGGAPLPGREVRLDRTRMAATDTEGRFEFDEVEAGVRGLEFPSDRFVAVRVAPGEVRNVEIGPGLPEVCIELRDAGVPLTGTLVGVIVGRDALGSVREVRASEGVCRIHDVIPGRYLLLARGGRLAPLTVEGARATVDLGRTSLRVTGREGTSVCVVPADADALVDLFALRVATRTIPGSGETSFTGLPGGPYRVIVESPRGSGRKASERSVTLVEGADATIDVGGD